MIISIKITKKIKIITIKLIIVTELSIKIITKQNKTNAIVAC